MANLSFFEQVEGIDLVEFPFLVMVSVILGIQGGQRTSRKKNVALLALSAACGSGGSAEATSFCAGNTGVLLRALMSFGEVNMSSRGEHG